MHHFLGLTYGSVLAQGGKSAQGIRASQSRSYLQPPGKVSKGASYVAMGPWNTAPPWTAIPLSSLSFYHHYCQTTQALQLDLFRMKSMEVFSPPFFKCSCYFVFLLEKADGKIYTLHLKLNVLTFTVDLRDFKCLDCLRLSFKEVLSQTIFASSETKLCSIRTTELMPDWSCLLLWSLYWANTTNEGNMPRINPTYPIEQNHRNIDCFALKETLNIIWFPHSSMDTFH